MQSPAIESGAASSDVPAIVHWILGAPLWMKLAGTNLLVVIAAVVAVRTASGDGESFALLERWLLGALAAALIINISLVLVALRPLRTLERTVSDVRRGNIMARVPPSLLADRDMARVGTTLNLLVDTLVEDRARSRELAALVISQSELDQLRIAHELHESAAQQLAAQVMQISIIARDTSDAHTRGRLEEVRAMASDTLEHLRALASEIRPRTRGEISGRPGSRDDRAIDRTSRSAAVRKW
ncbi:MAG TPA: histidine kinase dimerization/phosphoacceptor domain-containing protein [Gemmatimonadaceae bacterium]|nr:histidine kinase dimerization/phosphoacceptor domain-containing protein [Gemmatimonadaceae bacterium]